MTNARYSLAARTYTVVTGSGVNVSTTYPATHLALLERPRRVCRSINTSTTRIVLDLGASAPAIQAFSVETVNFGSLLIEGHASDSWGAPSFSEAFVTTATDDDDGRRKRLCLPGAAFSYRYVRLTPSSPDSGATYFELGSFAAWPTFTTLAKNPAVPYERRPTSRAERLELGGGTVEIGQPTPISVHLTWQANLPFDDTTARAQYRDLARVPENRVILWHENVDPADFAKMLHVRRTGAFALTRDGSTLERVTGATFEEVA